MFNNTARDYSEKRDFIRMKVKTNMSLLMDSGETIDAVCEDLSGTGMSIRISRELPPDTQCRATIPSQNPSFPPLKSLVKVVRCTKLDDGNYEAGLAIVSIDK